MKKFNQMIDGNNFISHHLKNDIPFAAGKIGGTELKLLYTLLNNSVIPEDLKIEAENVSGLVPTTQESLKWFSNTYLEALNRMDLLCKWSKIIPQLEHDLIQKTDAYITPLQHIEPYFFETPWTNFLKDKKVLVFSPFAESFSNNFNNFDKIWNGKITNNFELKAVSYPTSITITENNEFVNYKEIYEKYIEIINTENFDVGIFGTGYTGLMFASECKKIGKAGIHLGGSTQMLFGVLGSRWKQIKEFEPLINEHWTHPQPQETPRKFYTVEDGCYW